MDRRTFIASGSSALLGTALFGGKSYADTAALSVKPTAGGPLITPNGQFFLYSQMRYPEKLPASIQIDGLVDTPARYSTDDLSKIPPVEEDVDAGMLRQHRRRAADLQHAIRGRAAVGAVAEGRDSSRRPNPRASTATTAIRRSCCRSPNCSAPETMLVGKLGGAPVPMQHGSPYTRLFIPGAGGNHHPKWVSRITLVANDAPEHPAPPMAGFLSKTPTVEGTMSGVTLTGYHYTGAEAVGKVEVSTDNGTTYQPMPLPPQPDPDVWVTWELTFRPPERGFYVLRVRATSASGRKQDFPGAVAVEVR